MQALVFRKSTTAGPPAGLSQTGGTHTHTQAAIAEAAPLPTKLQSTTDILQWLKSNTTRDSSWITTAAMMEIGYGDPAFDLLHPRLRPVEQYDRKFELHLL
jgi:hypothetical protein